MPPMSTAARARLIVVLAVVLLGVMALVPAVPQDPDYHGFADERTWLGIPRVGDVLTNLPFVVVGLWGLWVVGRARPGPHGMVRESWERGPWLAWFAGLFATGFTSGWYHLAPDNGGLFWDRLSLSVVFTAMLPIMLAEFGDRAAARRWWLPLTALGPASVCWWIWTESRGAGDLRLYGFLQGLPLLVVPLCVLLLPARYPRRHDWLWVLAFYVVAKLGEAGDAWIYHATGIVSGHSLKHLAAAGAGWWLLRMLRLRAAPAAVTTATPAA